MDTIEFKPINIKIEELRYDEDCEPIEKSYKMNHYCKKKTLSHLKQNGTNLKKILRKFKCSQEEIEGYINNKAEEIQENVHHECNSPSFQAINIWMEKFKENNFNLSNNELGLTIKLIAATEEHPDPKDCEGINFRDLYSFLGKVMSGEPTMELDQQTRQFLCECFQELSDEAHSPIGDLQLKILEQKLKSKQFHGDATATASRLDPLNINNIPGLE